MSIFNFEELLNNDYICRMYNNVLDTKLINSYEYPFGYSIAGGIEGGLLQEGVDISGNIYNIVTFLQSDIMYVKSKLYIDYILIGGGGAGGRGNTGGGGGAGRVLQGSTILSRGEYNIIIGQGGEPFSENGESTEAIGLVALGGGNGCTGGYSVETPGYDGGSGGGGCGTWSASYTSVGGSNISTYGGIGHNGGNGLNTASTSDRSGGGGGGAGGIGSNAANRRGGYGGVGVNINITGDNLWYAAGGQGGTNGSQIDGRVSANNIGGMGASGYGPATNGENGTGSGGGGAREGTYTTPGNGGSGVFIVRYIIN